MQEPLEPELSIMEEAFIRITAHMMDIDHEDRITEEVMQEAWHDRYCEYLIRRRELAQWTEPMPQLKTATVRHTCSPSPSIFHGKN